LEALERFTNVFRDINRRVCADTYANYFFSRENWENPEAGRYVPETLWRALVRMHELHRCGEGFTTGAKRELFLAHFLYEQEYIVGPAITAAVAELAWPSLLRVALRPSVRFAYFGQGQTLNFQHFASRNERIEHGLQAFEWAAEAGWERVEERLRDYALLPTEAFEDPDGYFAGVAMGMPGLVPEPAASI
jgi:hypothetical protein